MQSSSVETKKKRRARDPRDNPIESPPTGVASDPPPMPIADPDPRRPPYDGPQGGSKKRP